MKQAFAILAVVGIFFMAVPAMAEPIYEAYNGSSGSGNTDTNVVDLSDVDTDQPVQSPSFENTTPAGQAPGQPIE